MTDYSKRKFLKTSVAIGATLPFFNIVRADNLGSEQLKVGFIGLGKITTGLLRAFMSRNQVVAICDVDTVRRDMAVKRVNDQYGNQDCASYVDYRDLLARDDIDVVVIATPDHWHATMVIDAARAGKDIYCEKPLTHDIDEAIRVMDEVKKAGVVLQTGSQQRSMKEFRCAAELVRNEVAGKLIRVSSNFWGPGRSCDLGEEALEPGLDWNRWVGPAPIRPYNSVLSPRGFPEVFPQWRAFKEFGGGGVCDMGAHHLDIAQWALDRDDSGPIKVIPPEDLSAKRGARFVYDDGIELTHGGEFHLDFECENGRIQVSRGKFNLELEGKTVHRFLDREDGGSLSRAVALTEREFLVDAKVRLQRNKNGHQQDFLDCIATRGKPIANEVVGSRSAICCHLMNLAYYEQQQIDWDPIKLQFSSDSCDPAWLTGSRRDYLSA